MSQDVIKVRILADGTIKSETDPISGPNHQSAEAFMQGLTQLTGGPVTRERRGNHTHTHQHTHGHEHKH